MKKLPPITPTDLARIAPLTEDLQRVELAKLKRGFPPFTYKPTRNQLPDIMNVQVGGLFVGQKVTWEQVRAALTSSCVAGDETVYNLMAAEALYRFADEHDIAGRVEGDGGFEDMALGAGHRFALWEKAVIRYNDRPHVMFVDLRGTKYLTRAGRRFAFSAQHEQIRERDPDLADAGLLILHVEAPVDDVRRVVPYTDAGVPLYSFAELDAMTRRTYALWEEIWFGRMDQARRKAAGDGDGPLFS